MGRVSSASLVLMSWAGMAFTLGLFKFWCHEKESINPASNNLNAIFVRNDGLWEVSFWDRERCQPVTNQSSLVQFESPP